MGEKLPKLLINLGLSDKEALVYLSALSLGPASVLGISRAAGLKRTTVYTIVESLKEKGLMRIEVEGWKQRYACESPKQLERMLERRREEFHGFLPELLSRYNLRGGESFVRYYEGLAAVKGVYEELLEAVRPRDSYLVVSDQARWYTLDPIFYQKFIERRARKNLSIRLLLQDSPKAREHQRLQKTYREDVRLLPAGTELTTNLVVTPQRAVIHQLTPPILAIVLENRSTITMFQQMFDVMWASTPPGPMSS